MRSITAFVASILLVCPLANPVRARQAAAVATLSGRIIDPNGAVVPGTQVTATQKATGIKRESVSDGEGFFILTNLTAGDYEVRAQAKGFAEKVFSTVTLQVGQSATLDVKLDINLTEKIIIDERGVPEDPINVNTSVVDGVINSHEIEGLPLNGRNFLELALLIPGNSPAPNFDPTKTNTLVISSAGQLGRGGNVTIRVLPRPATDEAETLPTRRHADDDSRPTHAEHRRRSSARRLRL